MFDMQCYVASILANHKLEKEKILYEISASNTALLHRIFYSLEVTAEDFCGVAGTPAASRGWGCVITNMNGPFHTLIGSSLVQ